MFPRGACPAKSGGSMMKTEGAQGGEIHSMHSPRSGTRERSDLGLGLEKKRISHEGTKAQRGEEEDGGFTTERTKITEVKGRRGA